MVRVRIAVTVLVLAALAVCASSRLSDAVATARLAIGAHGLRIVAFGSSSTQGVGASSPAAAYPAQLEALLRTLSGSARVEVANRGVSGEDVDDMMARLDRDVLATRPDLVIWQTGSNDALRHVPLDRFERETRAGVAAMRKAGIALMLMEPQWCPALERTGAADRFRDAVRRIGADTGVAVIRRSELMHDWVRSGLLTAAAMLSPDGLHMRDAGYKLLAIRVAAEVLHLEAAAAPRIATARL